MSALSSKADVRGAKRNSGHMREGSAKRKTAARRSLEISLRYFDQAAIAAPFFFLRTESRPNAPRPVRKSGKAPGRGTGLGVPEIRKKDSAPSLALFQTAWSRMPSVRAKPG